MKEVITPDSTDKRTLRKNASIFVYIENPKQSMKKG